MFRCSDGDGGGLGSGGRGEGSRPQSESRRGFTPYSTIIVKLK